MIATHDWGILTAYVTSVRLPDSTRRVVNVQRWVCICQARAAFADVVLQYFSPKVPILRQIHREIAMTLTGRPNPRPLCVQRIATKKWYLLLQAQLSSFVKFFQVTSWIVSVLTKWHHIYGRSSDDHCLGSPRLEQSNDALMEVSFDASAEELHLSCRRITKMEKYEKIHNFDPFW